MDPVRDEKSLKSLSKDVFTAEVEVKIVGVIGCSASGKSTAAHQLARCLHSPFYPITIDHFFLDEVCAQLGTYDDYRCIDYTKIAQWMRCLKESERRVTVSRRENCVASNDGDRLSMRDAVQDAWLRQMLLLLPGCSTYARFSTTEPVAAEEQSAVKSNFVNEVQRKKDERGDVESSEQADCIEDGNDDDASLCAHEAEEEERRKTAYALPSVLSHNSQLVARTEEPSTHQKVTVYVVWEGFTLLCSADVNACIDVAVQVRCDAETACLRRFFRSPRRHLVQHVITPLDEDEGKEDCEGEEIASSDATHDAALEQRRRRARAAVVARVVRQLYRPRIEQLWAVRARAEQRKALEDDLLTQMHAQGGWDSSDSASSDEAAVVREVKALLAPAAYNPPRPGGSVVRDGVSCAAASGEACADRCWTADGIPTKAFQHFWESESDMWSAQCPALSWAQLGASSGAVPPAQGATEGSSEGQSCTLVSSQGASDETNTSSVVQLQSETHLAKKEFAASPTITGREYVDRVLAERGAAALFSDPTPVTSQSRSSQEGSCPNENLAGTASSLDASLVAAALAPFYYEFRYWFFLEVLYYDRLLKPLQEHRLRHRWSSGATPAAAAERAWFVVENGRAAQGSKEGELLKQTVDIASAVASLT